MPELPEVEIVKRGLSPVLIGGRLKSLTYNRPNLRVELPADLPERLAGQVFTSILRRGKYILAFAERGDGFVLHLGMSGVVRIEGKGAWGEDQKHDHVVFEMEEGGRIVFNDPRRFGFLKAIHLSSWQDEEPFSKMGPEPLGNDFNGPAMLAAFAGRKTPIKVALLNQQLIAGIGNIYACEALFMAGICPERLAGEIQESEAEALAEAVRCVLKKAIEAGGSSLKDYKNTEGDLGYFQHQFCVYGRGGGVCAADKCDNIVEQIVQAGRSTFFCSHCQR